MRKAHILSKKLKTSNPRNLLFFDCESIGRRNPNDASERIEEFLFGWVIATERRNGRLTRYKSQPFYTPMDFWEFVQTRLSKEHILYVFAHNLSFDLTMVDFWYRCSELGMEVEMSVLDNPPTFIKVRWHNASIIFVDTLNYWRTSLAEMGKGVGLRKFTFPNSREINKRFLVYCRRDVKILQRSIIQLLEFIEEHDLGGLSVSQASLAMRAFKRRFMETEIYIHDNDSVCQLERDAYYGGRVECFFVGKTPTKKTFKLDVNSLYPYVMLENQPVKMVHCGRECTINELETAMEKFGAIARVRINDYNNTYPKREDGRMIFVSGEYYTTLAGPELLRALRSDSIESIQQYALYDMFPIFQSYVYFFWNMRQKAKKAGNRVHDMFAKYMLNSLYGKFGQRYNEFRDLTWQTLREWYTMYGQKFPDEYIGSAFDNLNVDGIVQWYPLQSDKSAYLRRVGDKVQIRLRAMEHHESFPAIAAYVTAYAREYLRKLLVIAGKRNVYYCDTDSLFVNPQGFAALKAAKYVDDNVLGSLKLESVSGDVEIFNLKSYRFGQEIKTKGIKKNAIYLGNNTYMQDQFEGLPSILKHHEIPYVVIKWVVKQLTTDYKKGDVSKDGWVKPFIRVEPITQHI